MSPEALLLHGGHCLAHSVLLTARNHNQISNNFGTMAMVQHPERIWRRPFLVTVTQAQLRWRRSGKKPSWVALAAAGVPLPPLDLTEDNVREVLADARVEFAQIFDTSVGMTGQAELAELDGPFVKISLKGRFWHERSTVLARLANYLKQRIPEILEVEIEDEKQLDDSPQNF